MKNHIQNALVATFCILVMSLAHSCSSLTPRQTEFSIDKMISDSKPINLADMGAEFETIKLKFPEGELVSLLNGVITTPENIYVRTSRPHQVYRLDRKGNLLNKISVQGRAKNEYTSIRSFFLDENDNICIQDEDRILTFTPEGEYLDTRVIDQTFSINGEEPLKYSRNMFMDKQGNLFEPFSTYMGDEPNNLIVTSPNQDTLLVNPNPLAYTFGGMLMLKDIRSLLYVGDEIVFNSQWSYNVYTIDSETFAMSPRYTFTASSQITNNDHTYLGNVLKERTYILDFTEDSKYLYLNVSAYGKKGQLYLIDKQTGKSFEADFKLNLPEDDELSFYPRWESNDEFIFSYDVKNIPEPTILLMKKL